MKKILSAFLALILVFTLTACGGASATPAEQAPVPSSAPPASSPSATPPDTLPTPSPVESTAPASPDSTPAIDTVSTDYDAIASQLKALTDKADPGPTKNYFYTNGNADINQSSMPAAGQVSFTSDALGRASVAKASLTYEMFKASAGSRQGTPLDPPTGWPKSNPEIAINYSMTNSKGQLIVYHGYLWNRSHSVADSLAGTQSYTSADNFTTGTRAQNVGANQNGGMRAAEEIAEDYWKTHTDSTATIYYQTTPLYHGDELIPRGSVVDILSSDGLINTEIVVINDAEGWAINYFTGEATSSSPVELPPSPAVPSASPSPAPAPSASPSPAPVDASIQLVSITSPVKRNATASVTVIGKPDTQYTITVYYPSGPSTASGLDPKTSNADGKVSWSWKIGSRTTQASHYLVISGGGKSLTVDFTVQ